MKYQFFALLFILSLVVSFFETETSFRFYSSTEISKSKLKEEIIARMERVDELRVMKELAAELGIKQVYLFGGSAAAWAHYVYWDLEREAGMGNYDKSRFDYDYTSIFRSNQDMDIVVDVDPGNQHLVSEFERKLQARFTHFQGNKSAWEVRPLRFDFGTKEKILGNQDFLNQNSDSHSTGLISVTDNDEVGIRDFKDWENKDNHFFDDVYNRELHYYRDQSKHKGTKRFKEGVNPEIFSAVRYLTKAFQYELKIDAESLKQLRELLAQFDSSKDLEKGYSKNWIEKNAIKLYQNAIDLEFAYETMNDLKLQELLISINNNIDEINSMAWWMNRMPLLSREFGDSSKGKTAGELGIKIVAHETNDFAAYESITKSHSGKANVFISRKEAIGETAVHGDGFYTRIGKKGAKGFGLTIRFEVNPYAREGVDFIQKNDYIIIHNKKMLTVIPESLEISPTDYFRKLANDELIFDHSDKAVQEKVRRKIGLKLNSMSEKEKEKIVKIIKKHVQKYGSIMFDDVLKEWFSLELSLNYPEIIDDLIKKDELAKKYVIKDILSQKHWANDERGVNLLAEFIDEGEYLNDIANSVFVKSHWIEHERGFEFLERLIEDSNALRGVSFYVLSRKELASHEKGFDFLMKVIDKYPSSTGLSEAHWATHERSGELIDFLMETNRLSKIAGVLHTEEWAQHEKALEILDSVMSDEVFDEMIVVSILSNKFWAYHSHGAYYLERLIMNTEEWITDSRIASDILSKSHWANHEKGFELLRKYLMNTHEDPDFYKKLLPLKIWAENEKMADLIDELIEDERFELVIVEDVLSQEHWSNHPRGIELLEKVVGRGNFDDLIEDEVLSKYFWQNHPYFVKKFAGEKVTVEKIKLSLGGRSECSRQLKSIL